MADPKGFLKVQRVPAPERDPAERVRDYKEIFLTLPESALRDQASRCMDCGVPFCNDACPLGNLIPDWNDLARTGRWREAVEEAERFAAALTESAEIVTALGEALLRAGRFEEVDALHAKSGIPRQRLVRCVALHTQRIDGSRAQVLREPRRDQGLADAALCLNDAMKLTHGLLLWAEPKGEDGGLIRAPAWEDFGGGSA